MDSLTKCFKTNMTVTDLSEMTNKEKENCFGTDDVVSLFTCSTRGIVSLSDMQYRGAESSLPVAHPGDQVLADILFKPGLIANALTQCSAKT